MKVGRPSKYNKEAMEPKIYDLASVGGSKEEIAAEIGIDHSTLYDWIDPKSPRFNKEFSDIITMAETISMAWWEKMGRTCLFAEKFQGGVFNKQIAGRFPKKWRDTERREQQQLDSKGLPADAVMQIEFVGGSFNKDKDT